MTDTTIKPINFMDINDNLLNEFCRVVTDDGIQAGVDFAVAHSGCTREDAVEAAEAVEDENADAVLFALSDEMVRTPAEIREAAEQAFHRCWANRAAQHSVELSAGPWAELMLKYPDLHQPEHHGPYAGAYYTGVLAALRWALGNGWNGDT